MLIPLQKSKVVGKYPRLCRTHTAPLCRLRLLTITLYMLPKVIVVLDHPVLGVLHPLLSGKNHLQHRHLSWCRRKQQVSGLSTVISLMSRNWSCFPPLTLGRGSAWGISFTLIKAATRLAGLGGGAAYLGWCRWRWFLRTSSECFQARAFRFRDSGSWWLSLTLAGEAGWASEDTKDWLNHEFDMVMLGLPERFYAPLPAGILSVHLAATFIQSCYHAFQAPFQSSFDQLALVYF